MSRTDPTLLDLMTMLIDLHPKQLQSTGVASIKLLRLVSKGFSEAALTAVEACEVHVGTGGIGQSPTALELAKVMAGARLLKLRVILNLSSGESCAEEGHHSAANRAAQFVLMYIQRLSSLGRQEAC